MGGIILLYAIPECLAILSAAACLSTHWIGIFETNASPWLDAVYANAQPSADQVIRTDKYNRRNFTSQVFDGAGHTEGDRAARLNLPLMFFCGVP